VTLDRARDLVTVRSGWLGLRRQRRRLSEFNAMTTFPAERALVRRGVIPYVPWFDVALRDGRGKCLVIGKVSRSWQLAQDVAKQIAHFTRLSATLA